MPIPTIGTPAPHFSLPDETGTLCNLSDYKGKWVVTYFYPKAMTSGCTTQACTLRDGMAKLKALNCVVLGVSPDKPQLLSKFIEKEGLNFTLLADEDHKMADAYGAWQEKSMYGKTYMGMARMTVLIDPSGIIRNVWPKVKPEQQVDDILLWFKSNKV
jgi:thioredoxin-dependent peroxiredoxin